MINENYPFIETIHSNKKNYGNCLRIIKKLMEITQEIEYKNVVS